MTTTSESLEALRRANPRNRPGFAHSIEAAGEEARRRIASAAPRSASSPRPRLVRVSALGTSVAAVAAVALVLTLGSGSGGPGVGVDDATAAIQRAATQTAASAEQSGVAEVTITHDGAFWAGTTVRWNGDDVSVSRNGPDRVRKHGAELLVVDGVLYGNDPEDGGWIRFGDPAGIDPDSGTTPAEYLAAVREDVGGTTLSRLTHGLGALTAHRRGDGSTVYRGTVAAGRIARETGFKEGEALRVLPFGYVAHDEAADPANPLDVAVTVGADGVVREIAVAWGTWRYVVAYSGLGATAAPAAPANARSIKELRRVGRAAAGG